MQPTKQHDKRNRIVVIGLGLLAVVIAISLIVNLLTQRKVQAPTPTTNISSSAIKPVASGLMTRNGPPPENKVTFNNQPLIKGFVIQVNWKDVQPNGPDELATTAIDQQLAFAKAHNLSVRFRFYAGYNTPEWVMKKVGSVNWQGTPGDAGPDSYSVPKFWTSEFQAIWKAYNQKLSDKYDSNPEVRDVVSGMCTTNFAEPFIRQFSESQNITTAEQNGYSDGANNACLKATIDLFKTSWPTTHYAMAFNPYQSTSGSQVDKIATPKEIARYCVSTLGKRCELGNNSMKADTRGTDYDALYTMLQTFHVPIYIQTAADKRLGDWESALSNCINVGATSIELPSGYQEYDAAKLQTYNDKLIANLNKLPH